MEYILRTKSGDGTREREEHWKDGGDTLNCGVSDNTNWIT
jgi:hypothetical protein